MVIRTGRAGFRNCGRIAADRRELQIILVLELGSRIQRLLNFPFLGDLFGEPRGFFLGHRVLAQVGDNVGQGGEIGIGGQMVWRSCPGFSDHLSGAFSFKSTWPKACAGIAIGAIGASDVFSFCSHY